MKVTRFVLSKHLVCSLFAACMICVTIFLNAGCDQREEPVFVTFSKTIPIPQPTRTAGSEESLRVAVAAMISPKETSGYYRDLLEYLGERTGKQVSLVQRKTYTEINELLQKVREQMMGEFVKYKKDAEEAVNKVMPSYLFI